MGTGFTFARFAELIGDIAQEQIRNPDKVAEFKQKLTDMRAKFSLIEDGGMDSLDITEAVMRLEELLVEKEGPRFSDIKLEGKDFDNAKNIGDFYTATCKQIKQEPIYEATAA